MNLAYQFLGYVANNAGIKFGDKADVKRTIRFDHKMSTAPGSTKTDPIPFIRNSIAVSEYALVKTCTDDKCGKSVPVTASVSWSGPLDNPEALNKALEVVQKALTLQRDNLNAGFLPTNDAFTIVVGE